MAPLASEEADEVLGDLSYEERFDQAWLVGEGRRYPGHESIWHSLYLLPLGSALRVLRLMPGFGAISHRAYRWVADKRKSACRIDRRPTA